MMATTSAAPKKAAPSNGAAKGSIPKDVLLDLHRRMLRIRLLEEAAGRLASEARIPGFIHLYVGEEAVAAGGCVALNDDDYITSTHRGHGHLVAKGGQFKQMMAEFMGKSTGYCKGKGGSMHISDLDLGMLGANGIVGAGVPIAAGAAFASKYRDDGRVTMAFFGDGSTNIGAFHEAANMACALHLPLVFMCENNEYAEYTARERVMAITDVADRAVAYGMPGVVVDGMDVIAVYEAAQAAVARARSGEGPSMIECKTYRYYDHAGVSGIGKNYRSDEEVAAWKARDPIDAFEAQLAKNKVLTKAAAKKVRDEIDAELEEAIEFAENSPMPDPLTDMLTDVYTEMS
jgi:acetoin:2,6-dichlorophenolindophenol oxidoreductase subunit alpha